MNNRLAALEALLFIHGEPLSMKKIATILELASENSARELAGEFQKKLAASDRGLALVLEGEKAQLVTKPAFGNMIHGFAKTELSEDLTPASVETLAIVCYFGPLSRSKIEYLRGVNSMFILRSLLLRGLVERFPDPENASAFLYRASFEMLRHVGVEGKENLPEYQKFQDLLKRFEASPI